LAPDIHTDPIVATLTWLTFLLPLFSFLISMLITERYSWLTSLVAPLLMFMSALAAGALLVEVWNKPPEVLQIQWFSLPESPFTANLLVANQSALMLFVVSVVSFLVHLYSTGYMASDRNIRRYFAMLGFFTFAMNGIVLADSLLLIFVFWELVGFSSYMLIGHYDDEVESGSASKKAFVLNRVGDAGFLVGLMIVWVNTGSFNLSEIVSADVTYSWQTAASLCIFCGVVGKSAQFPLFTWLPDAMQGPTPVSALIHAATMVAAGVYLMARVFPLFTETSLVAVTITGAITSVIGALAALSQFDIKRILAYSTISQLGLMILAIGLGLPDAALLHLFTHAFFKACLFLCAGSVIHALHHATSKSGISFDVQDIRNLGGLNRKLPVTFITFIISAASLAGIPFFSGFISKEGILTAVWTHTNVLSWVMFAVIILVSFLTVVYTFRMAWYTFFGELRTKQPFIVEEVPTIMRAPVVLLAACSLWFVVSWNPLDFTGWVIPYPKHQPSAGITAFSVLWISLAFAVSWLIFKRNPVKANSVLMNAFHVDTFYKFVYRKTIKPLSSIAEYTDRKVIDGVIHRGVYAQVTLAHVIGWFDRYVIDGFVHFIASLTQGIGAIFRNLQGGKIQVYIFWAAFAIIIFLICTLN
jgi:NADH-quinone oxidoreductase subunit L